MLPICLVGFFSGVVSYCVSLRSGLRVVMSVTISSYKRCSVRLNLQLFVGGIMSYLRYLCIVVSITNCVLFLFYLSSLVFVMLLVSLGYPF